MPGNHVAAEDQDVTWDVVGMPRKPGAAAARPSSPPEWTPGSQWTPESQWPPAASQIHGTVAAPPSAYTPVASAAPSYAAPIYAAPSYAAPTYSPASYSEPPPLPYNPVRSSLRRTPGWIKAATVIGTVLVGLGVRWAFGLFFGADFSNDGRIEVDPPAYWTTISVSNPDITYAMDDAWSDVKGSGGIQLSQPGMQLIDARALSTDFSGNSALVVFVASSDATPGKRASREVFESAFRATLDKLTASGASVVSHEKVTVLKSNAGDNWGFSSASVSLSGGTLTIYDAASVVDDYVVEIELIVPDGVSLTRSDILAVVNSVRAR